MGSAGAEKDNLHTRSSQTDNARRRKRGIMGQSGSESLLPSEKGLAAFVGFPG
jgi:hypothetical protein